MINTKQKYSGVSNTRASSHSTGLVTPMASSTATVSTKAIAQITAQNGSSGMEN